MKEEVVVAANECDAPNIRYRCCSAEVGEKVNGSGTGHVTVGPTLC